MCGPAGNKGCGCTVAQVVPDASQKEVARNVVSFHSVNVNCIWNEKNNQIVLKHCPPCLRFTKKYLLLLVVSEQQDSLVPFLGLTLCPPSLIRNIDMIVLPAFGPFLAPQNPYCSTLFSLNSKYNKGSA